MPNPLTCPRLYADADGESHFGEIEFDMTSIEFAPPAPALDVSESIETKALSWMRFPEGWHNSAHVSPRRQVFLVLSGEIEVWTSTGDTRTFKPGDHLVGEDTTGKGHGARALNGEVLAAMISLE
jgi:mannose-6-phosphate isomerase-like protein (cupin superfamily)